jgi:predicted nucleic acid-binding protein
MASKIFLDANLLLDLVLKRPGFATAQGIIQAGIDGEIGLYTSPSVLHITAYFAGKSFTQKQTKQLLLTLLNDVTIIDCDHPTVLAALANGNIDDTEDALQYFTAIRHGLDCFISADKDLKKAALPQLPVYAAAELLAELKGRDGD